MLVSCFTEVDQWIKNLGGTWEIIVHIENGGLKRIKRFAPGYRASDWNKTKHGAVCIATYGLLVQHLCSILLPN